MKFKEKLLENDFGAYLYDLRMKHEYTVEELVEKLNIETIKYGTLIIVFLNFIAIANQTL